MGSTTSAGSEKAFKRKSVVIFAAKVSGAVVVIVALALVGFRFGLPAQWDAGVAFAKEALDGPLLSAFENLSGRYVDASDLDTDGKKAWKARLVSLSDALRTGKGTAEQRTRLKQLQEGLIGAMKDGGLSKDELAPFEKDLDLLLAEIEAVEKKKGQ